MMKLWYLYWQELVKIISMLVMRMLNFNLFTHLFFNFLRDFFYLKLFFLLVADFQEFFYNRLLKFVLSLR